MTERGRRAPAGGTAENVQHGRLKRNSAAAEIARFLGIAVAVVAVSALCVAGIAVGDVVGSIKPGIRLPGHSRPAEIDAIKGGVNLLLVGTDTREGQGGDFGSLDDSAGIGNNDVTMLMHIAEDHSSATVVSFPRDLIVTVPKCPNGKGSDFPEQLAQFNSTLQEGGIGCTLLTVQSLTGGLDIPFAGLIKFQGVIAMSNAVGGVQVCVANRIDDNLVDPPLHMAPGKYTLQGARALSFLRTRHGLSNGSDLARISNQQVFLSSLVRKIKSNGTLSNPTKLYGLAKAATSNMLLSQSLTNPVTLVKIGLALKNVDFDKILFLQYPVVTDPDNPNRVVPDEESAKTLFAAIKADKNLTISGSTGGGAVLSTPKPTPPGPGKASGSPSTPTASTPTASPSAGHGGVVLPDNVHGQSAAEQTCSNGSG